MVIKNGKLFQKQGAFAKGILCIREDRIERVIIDKENNSVEEAQDAKEEMCGVSDDVIDATGLYVIPGLTDIHFHGCVGYDFCDGTQEAIAAMATYELKNGITTICPASMTLSEEKLARIFKEAADYNKCCFEQKLGSGRNASADLIGINMEGPFISSEKKGAQNGAFIQNPDADMFMRLQKTANGLIKLCDIAPETEGALECISAISDKVTVSLAHTCADYDTAKKAFEAGAKHVTHLYNAMPPFSHRAPGVIGAACDCDDVYVELITDGIHVHPSVVRATFKMFGDDRIVLISDSMRATGLDDGHYSLGGLDVVVKGRLATLADGKTIAGSATNLMDCVRIAVKEMGIPLEAAVKCAATNPAKAIGIFDGYGSLTAGKKANIVMIDEDLEVKYIIKDGRVWILK